MKKDTEQSHNSEEQHKLFRTSDDKNAENEILEIVKNLSLKCGLQLIFECRGDSKWDAIINNCSYSPTLYTKANISYELAYQEGHGGKWLDMSCTIMWGKDDAAIWPITLSQRDSQILITSQGQPLLPPLFSETIKRSVRKEITKSCVNFLAMLSEFFQIEEIISSDPFTNSLGLSEWNLLLSVSGAECTIHYDLYLQIHSSIDLILMGFRRTLRDYIKEGQKLWQHGILSADSESIDKVWQEFQDLHLEASGRLTRSIKSWDLQKKAIIDNNAFLVFLRSDNGRMIGGGYFTFSRDEGVYSVAAYDRSLFKLPIGHLVQYIAIENFIKREIPWYKLGNLPFPSEKPKPSEKELSIAVFKKQFSSHVFPNFKFICQLNKCKNGFVSPPIK